MTTKTHDPDDMSTWTIGERADWAFHGRTEFLSMLLQQIDGVRNHYIEHAELVDEGRGWYRLNLAIQGRDFGDCRGVTQGAVEDTRHRPRLRVLCLRAGLTPRQCDVLEQMARGSVVKEAAYALGLSPGTVKNHLTAMRRRKGARTTVELLALLAWPEDRAA